MHILLLYSVTSHQYQFTRLGEVQFIRLGEVQFTRLEEVQFTRLGEVQFTRLGEVAIMRNMDRTRTGWFLRPPKKHFVCRGYKKNLWFFFHDIFKQHNQGNLMRPTFTQTASHAVTVCRIFLIKFWAFCTRDLSAWNKYKTGRLHLREHPWKRQPSFEHVFLLCRIQK